MNYSYALILKQLVNRIKFKLHYYDHSKNKTTSRSVAMLKNAIKNHHYTADWCRAPWDRKRATTDSWPQTSRPWWLRNASTGGHGACTTSNICVRYVVPRKICRDRQGQGEDKILGDMRTRGGDRSLAFLLMVYIGTVVRDGLSLPLASIRNKHKHLF